MELKSYQQKVIEDLETYLEYLQKYQKIDVAYNRYCEDKWGPYDPLSGKGMEHYKNNVPSAPNICIKVPTAGGKTFIACNALRSIFNASDANFPKVVVWLVPWSNLLNQTVDNLKNPDHPYRQKLDTHFNHRVEVYEKKDLLQATNFNPTTVQDQLSIIVMSFASLRAANKEDRKVYQENSTLAPFASQYKDDSHIMEETDETALINVIRSLNPVLIVDESHNAESDLSVDMLRNLNPSFILDLTATPKKNSNIISLVPAIQLKMEHMVKLPVIVYNHQDKTDVINSALHLQRKLELLALEEQKNGGKYIRPIVLFQAQPKTKNDNTTFEKLKEQLLQIGIPEEQIKIKTANKDELKGIDDLMAKECPVRYIITVNALKEGWDCPFAYILASLADKSSAVDVEQILGRVLRQPYVKKHAATHLNVSYVLTASAKFNDTLQNIVKGLQASGFSENDYRKKDSMPEEVKKTAGGDPMEAFLFPEQQKKEEDGDEGIAKERIVYSPIDDPTPLPETPEEAEIDKMVEEQTKETEEQIRKQEGQSLDDNQFFEMGDKVRRYKISDQYREIIREIRLPEFYLETTKGDIFGTGEEHLSQEPLLKGFQLSKEDIKIDFEKISSDLYKVDIEQISKDEYTPRFTKVEDDAVRDPMVEYILSQPKEVQIKNIGYQLNQIIGQMYPIKPQEIKKYIERVLDNMNPEQRRDILSRKMPYAKRIKEKIQQHADAYAEEKFLDLIKIGKIWTKPTWTFREVIVPGPLGSSIGNSLYEREGSMNDFETSVITDLSSMANIMFWHRNLGRSKGFPINGFKSNHYPDFILYTRSGNIVIVETKGDDRDNPDSASKRRLGNKWADLAGSNFHYFMVYDKISPAGAYNRSKAKELISKL